MIRRWLNILVVSAVAVIFTPQSAHACAHNVDPKTVTSVGYSVFEKGQYTRYEFLAAKSLEKKKMVKLFFGRKTVNSSTGIKIINLRKNRKIATELKNLRLNVAGISHRGMRMGGAPTQSKTRIVGDKAVTVSVYKISDDKPAQILSKISKQFGFEFKPEHQMEAKLQQAFGLGLDLVVVSLKKAKRSKAPPTAIALRITPQIDYTMTYADYFKEISTLKLLEMNMSPDGGWGFRMGGVSFASIAPLVSESKGVRVENSDQTTLSLNISQLAKLHAMGSLDLIAPIAINYVPENYMDFLSAPVMARP